MKKVNTAADFPEFSRRIRCGFFQEIMSCEKGSGGGLTRGGREL